MIEAVTKPHVKPKTKYPPAGGFSAALLMTGEAELAVQQKPELS